MLYKDAGVDIEKGDAVVDRILPLLKSTHDPRVIGDPAGFAGLFALDLPGSLFSRRFRRPVLLGCTDGVGTKLRIAHLARRHDTVGIDLVAMCVNDLIVYGGEPLFFLDYFASGALNQDQEVEVLKGIAAGCRQAGCALLGGETAEMPGFYHGEDYDLAGFAVGIVDRSRIVDGSRIEPGDAVIGLGSSGVHSNGFSLVRRVFAADLERDPRRVYPELGRPLVDALLEPTIIYARVIRLLLARYRRKMMIRGIAHITGSGIAGNLERILPAGTAARIRQGSWTVPPVFSVIQKVGEVPAEEMFRVFNMGLGMILVVSQLSKRIVLQRLKRARQPAWEIGEIAAGDRRVVIE